MTRATQNGIRIRSAVLRLFAAVAGAIACVALVRWTLAGGAPQDGALLGVNAALTSILVLWMVWKFTRKGDDCVRAETALRESDEQLRLFVNGVLEYAIIILDPQGRVVSWNAGAERIEGYMSAQIIGRSSSKFYVPEDVAAGKPAMELRMATELGQWRDEGWRVRANGTLFWANVLITALRDDIGNLRGFTNLTHDTTVHKQAEEDAALVAGVEQRGLLSSAHFSKIASEV